MLITCPSGLAFQARRWRIEDRKTLLDRKDTRPVARRMLEVVAGNCENAGPYTTMVVGKPCDFLQVANVDILSAIFDIRCDSKPMYFYDRWCERCGTKLELQQKLPNLPRKPLSPEAIQFLSTGQPIARKFGETELGIKLTFGSDLPLLEGASTVAEQLTVNTVSHIAYLVRGPGAEAVSDMTRIRAWYESLDDWELVSALEKTIDDIEGGIDMVIYQRCINESCLAELKFSLPLEVGFFVPSMEPRR